MLPVDHREVMDQTRTAYSRFADGFDTLEDLHWHLPADSAGWTVRDVVGHVVGAMRSAASVREMLSQQSKIKARVAKEGTNHVEVLFQAYPVLDVPGQRSQQDRFVNDLVAAGNLGAARNTATDPDRFDLLGSCRCS
jgi:hypothetical protein